MEQASEETGITKPAEPRFRAAGLTDTGKVRERNEDAFLCLPEHGVFVVADGMGGMRDGATASRTTIQCVEQAFTALISDPTAAKPTFEQRRDTLIAALEEANRRMQPKDSSTKQKRSGSTVVTLLLDMDEPNRAYVIHAGDSRLYRWRSEQLEQLTQDHSGTELLDKFGPRFKGSLLASQLQGVVTRGIGIKKKFEYDQADLDVASDDLFFICSDGLSNMVSVDVIQSILIDYALHSNLSATCIKLVEAANQAGGLDNITVILVRMGNVPEAVTAEQYPPRQCDHETRRNINQYLVTLFGRVLDSNVCMPGRVYLAIALVFCLTSMIGLMGYGILWHRAKPKHIYSERVSSEEEEAPRLRDLYTERTFLLERIEYVYNQALHMGDWASVQALLDQGHIDGRLTRDDYAIPLHRNAAAWYAVWNQVAAGQFDANIELTSFIDAHAQILTFLNDDRTLRHTEISWSEIPNERAHQYCAMIHKQQGEIVEVVRSVRDRMFSYHSRLMERVNSLHDLEIESERGVRLLSLASDMRSLRESLTDKALNIIYNRDRPWVGPRRVQLDWDVLLNALDQFNDMILKIEMLIDH